MNLLKKWRDKIAFKDNEQTEFVNAAKLEKDIQNYLTATGITKEELEKPILEILLIKDLSNALRYLKDCDLTKYNSLQLEMILKHLDYLQTLALEKCNVNKKKALPIAIGTVGCADFVSLFLVSLLNLPFNVWFDIILTVDTLMLPWSIFDFRYTNILHYNKLIDNLNKIADKIFLIKDVKSQEKVLEKKEKLGNSESLQERVTRIENDISDLGHEDLTIYFFNLLSEYVKCSNLNAESTSDICLEFCDKPYYEYVLEKNLDKLEREIKRIKGLKNLIIDMNKMFDDYLKNIANFTDKKEAFLELLSLSQNYITVERYDTLLITCFWETIRLVDTMDRVVIIQALTPDILDKAVVWIKNSIASYGYNIQILEQEIKEETDPKLYLLLLINKLEKLEQTHKDDQARKRANKEKLVQVC